MAFGAAELRVLRRALALALNPAPASAEDVQDCHRLAESLDEAMCEGVRLRAFLLADLARYRAALPGTAAGFLTLLEEALRAGYRPGADDLAALRALRGNPIAAALLDHCQAAAEQDVRARLARATTRQAAPTVPASRTRLTALPGGLSAMSGDDAEETPARRPADRPARRPAPPAPAPTPTPTPTPNPAPEKPSRPIPTPGEVFPPRRKPAPSATSSSRELAAG
ncbi:hypothetical protein ACIQOU_07495 [Streptomyces sp. NPDC091279]|uniref:hypothetical protein n=1 Tax=unclassified Streptomyces TaxID=2593676 RepID=UPI003826F7B7